MSKPKGWRYGKLGGRRCDCGQLATQWLCGESVCPGCARMMQNLREAKRPVGVASKGERLLNQAARMINRNYPGWVERRGLEILRFMGPDTKFTYGEACDG